MTAPGSTLWLLRHELRLDWRRRRETKGARRWLALALTLGAPVFLGVFVGVPVGLALHALGRPAGLGPSVVAAAALASSFMVMLSQALAAVVDALYERSDLELLFASPIPPQRVIAVRALAIAFAAFSVFGFFAVGPLIVIAAMGHPQWLAALAVFFGCALAATGVALALSLLLIRAVGPRRTRTIGHAAAVILGSAFFLGTQILTFASPGAGSVAAALRLAAAPGFHAPPHLDWGLRALAGEPLPFVVVMSLCLAVFLIGLGCTGPRFASLHAAALGARRRPARTTARTARFGRGQFAAVVVKEIRLLVRDPMLLPQVLLRAVYLIPVGLLAVRYGSTANFTALSGAILAVTLMANQLAGSLAWITVSAEDAPDLLASSPAPKRLLLRGKLCAAALIVAVVVAPLAVPLMAVAPFEGLVAVLGCAAGTASAGLLNLWWQRPGTRKAFRKRGSAPWFVTLAELGLGLLIAISTGLLAAHQLAGLAPALAASAVLAALRRPVTES